MHVYLQTVQQLKHGLYGEVTVMGKLTTVNHHQGALSMRSHSCDMCLQGIATCHCLGIGDDVGDVCFVLIHPVYDKTQVLVLILLTLPPVLSILLPLTPGTQQQTSAKFILW